MTAARDTINGTVRDLFTVIRASGADSRNFLHAQLTCDVRQLSHERSLCGAYLSPKGRVLGLLTLVEDGNDVLMLTHPTVADALVRRLRMFVLRSKVTLELEPDRFVSGRIEGAVDTIDPPVELNLAQLPVTREGDVPIVGWPGGASLRLSSTGTANAEAIDAAWLSRDCALGIPHVDDSSADRHIAQMLNLDRLGAVNFKKGCFPGQEIVARAHYRGQVKRRLHRYAGDRPLPATARLEYADGGGLAGEVLCSGPTAGASGHAVLAVVRDDRSSERLVAPEYDHLKLSPGGAA